MHTTRAYERPPRQRPRWGWLPGRLGVNIVIATAALGLLVTVVAGSEPGAVLGVFLIAGTLIAGLAVRADRVHMIIPVPALAYLVAGLIAGYAHDRAVDTSRSALAASALQWIASGFLAITAATLIAIALTTARRLRARGPASAGRQSRAG
jgi:hypothetical protein